MDEKMFWKIIDTIHEKSGGDMDKKCQMLEEELNKLSLKEQTEFKTHFYKAYCKAYTWNLWAAAYIFLGGCSDDTFMDFRSTLISMGSETYTSVLNNPETLNSVDYDDPEYEGFLYVVSDAGEDMDINEPDSPKGEPWSEEDVEKLFPGLKPYGEEQGEVQAEVKKKPWWKFR